MSATLKAAPQSKPWIQTPLIESAVLSKAASCRILLKLESVQPSGSFKSRGIGNLILSSVASQEQNSSDTRSIHFFASSGGNAGLAAVTASSTLGHKCSVVLPSSTESAMVQKISAAGATEVIIHGESWSHADKYMREIIMVKAEEQGERAVYIPPFDHPDVWTGNATIMEEIDRQLPDNDKTLDAVVCSVGGGGLFCGIMQGLSSMPVSYRNTKVIAVETHGADSLAQSIAKKELVTLSGITSVAKSLGAIRVAQKALDYGLQSNVTPVVIEDAEACASSWRFADDERMLTEPACGASIAMAYDGRLNKILPNLNSDSKVVIVVCGGSRIDLEQMAAYKKMFGSRAQELGLIGCGEETIVNGHSTSTTR